MLERLRRANPLPGGSVAVGAGLVVSGLGTYVFLALASHALDADAYASISVLWALVFAVGNGAMQPLEQEVARAVSARRAAGIGAGPVIRRATTIGFVFAAALCVLATATWPVFFDELFSGDVALFGCFLIALVAFAVGHLVRGTLSSHGRFVDYALFFGVEGLFRPLAAIVLAAAGVAVAGAYGLALVLATLAAAAVALRRPSSLLEPGPPAPWAELTAALGWLLVGTGSMALLLNGGTVAVDLLASSNQQDAAGVFLNGLLVARVPLFLFQAVLASLLPNLAHVASSNQWAEFRSALVRLLVAITAFGVVAVAGSALVGPTLIDRVFGSQQVLSASDIALLSASSVVLMAAATLTQAMIALEGHARMAIGWLLSFALFVVVTLVSVSDLFLRVELGLLAGSTLALVWTAVAVWVDARAHRRAHEMNLPEELSELMLQP